MPWRRRSAGLWPLLKGRRDKFYFAMRGGRRSPRIPQYRNANALLQGLEENLKASQLDYVDLWRIALPMEGVPDLSELERVEEATIAGLAKAKQQGRRGSRGCLRTTGCG